MVSERFRWWLVRDVWDVVRAASPTHLHLRNRLVMAFVATLIVDVLASVAMFVVEGDAPSTALDGFGDALYWTTSQLTTVSSTLPNPVTGVGQVVSVIVNLYAITVVSTLAGMFGAFFHRRGEERDPVRGSRTR